MNLYLVRHGQAVSKDEDTRRPLAEAGVETVKRVAAFLADAEIAGVTAIHHSTKLRAKQTAQTLAEGAGLQASLAEAPYLEPLADPEEAIDSLSSHSGGDLMLVGHLPHLNRLASRLVVGTAEREAFDFAAGGVLCLRAAGGDADSSWQVAWFLAPDLLTGGEA
ncbi:MAG: phosphohistidine phosphatase SixA [Gemmatimonadetes bacterium]|uniref:Phosphohistidine phosphatase SixA n=1 Tax=Candidatus Kutchimonas denitrificans TaxID=3056748 RepID=A0AAE5CBC9_9BACT|nr:phosphohistidine phosphatase SixA [Gemmatimonadota bacterium]NIR74265.1 phosphohistidine phosphatase SixA [Candidatus Kutchimonas denitrificans]NIS02520.1 phosphohistidine phosphatase SixA [Gemmatimonadota bacterium]NIT68396.1 phosphohistidine phosphatase SixA [Gemmatimonadota bacterium]NIU51848.1 phosphohistidine phosphatase SixA [Gemmatimonadota bacterium]